MGGVPPGVLSQVCASGVRSPFYREAKPRSFEPPFKHVRDVRRGSPLAQCADTQLRTRGWQGSSLAKGPRLQLWPSGSSREFYRAVLESRTCGGLGFLSRAGIAL